MLMEPSRYEEAGVSIDAQDKAITQIKRHVAETQTPRVLSNIGSFGGLFDISFPDMEHPVLVASADGVGTKLKIAFEAQRHDTVGRCLVNHCINDILVQGAKPLFFMDYIATGKLKPNVVEKIVAGMALACRQSGLAILGGEMAEMPGFYAKGEYDVAGFIVGVVDRAKILPSEDIQAGYELIGLPSTGLHTNGYSLARKIIFEERGFRLEDRLPGMDSTVAEALLAIHKPYYEPLKDLLAQNRIAAMAHITGGGFLDNLPRVLPAHLDAEINTLAYELPPLFRFFLEAGSVEKQEAYRVFNMGIGMVLIIAPEQSPEVVSHLAQHDIAAVMLGTIVPGSGGARLLG